MAMGSSGDTPWAAGATTPLLELGRGGMGVASLARIAGPGGFERLVVVKRLHPHLCERPDVVARFLDEARLAACVRHANVIATHQVGQDSRGYFLTLEYVEGASLEELADRAALRGETIPVPIVLRVALDALAGLDAAYHARDASGRSLELLHRDVSLQNLLVGCDGVTRLADFGIAKSVLSSVKTTEGFVLGKLVYLPPEYLQRKPSGPELDVYSLGVTLWIALAGRDPWPDADEAQLLKSILNDGVPPLSNVRETSPELERIVATACARDQAARFPDARAMAERIEAFGSNAGSLATHREVAELVERIAGKDLERRRELVARRLSEVVADDGAHPAASDADPRDSVHRAGKGQHPGGGDADTLLGNTSHVAHLADDVETLGISPTQLSPQVKIALVAGGLALLVVAGLLAARGIGSRPAAAIEPGPSASTEPEPAPRASAEAEIAPRASVQPEPRASASAEIAPRASAEAESAPRGSASASSSKAVRPSGPVPPGGISKRNPYH